MPIQETLYIKVQGKTYGPYEVEEFKSYIKDAKVPFSSWVYQNEDWRLFAEIDEFRVLHPEYSEKPASAPQKSESEKKLTQQSTFIPSTGATVSAEPIWFVIRDKKKYGPYSAADIVGQLQKKDLDSTAFVWRPGFPTWQRISLVNEFSKDAMRRLVDEGQGIDILVKRKHQRAPYEVEVIAHDNTKVIEGKTMVIGEGGLFLATTKPVHSVGSRLKLHFRSNGESEKKDARNIVSFNAVAEVVSVVRGITPGYCLKFVAISDADRKRIVKFVSERRSR